MFLLYHLLELLEPCFEVSHQAILARALAMIAPRRAQLRQACFVLLLAGVVVDSLGHHVAKLAIGVAEEDEAPAVSGDDVEVTAQLLPVRCARFSAGAFDVGA